MTGDLFHSDGSRKYLTQDERTAFLTAAARFPHDVRSFCHVLTYTGCRLAEALALSADRVDLSASRLTFETLKKRKRGVYRTVPVPPDVVTMLDFVHNIRWAQGRRDRGRSLQLWSWSPVTAWRRVKAVMQAAGISGVQASPKGLRHGFGVAAVQARIPLNLVQRWLGHAQLSTTAIYAEAIGPEEQEIAARMWT
jgi:integrase